MSKNPPANVVVKIWDNIFTRNDMKKLIKFKTAQACQFVISSEIVYFILVFSEDASVSNRAVDFESVISGKGDGEMS